MRRLPGAAPVAPSQVGNLRYGRRGRGWRLGGRLGLGATQVREPVPLITWLGRSEGRRVQLPGAAPAAPSQVGNLRYGRRAHGWRLGGRLGLGATQVREPVPLITWLDRSKRPRRRGLALHLPTPSHLCLRTHRDAVPVPVPPPTRCLGVTPGGVKRRSGDLRYRGCRVAPQCRFAAQPQPAWAPCLVSVEAGSAGVLHRLGNPCH
jgi:hypothetical protein